MSKWKDAVGSDPPKKDEPQITEAEAARAQATSPDVEGTPKVAPLEKAKEGDKPPQPPTAPAEPVPRFVHQNFRAPEGLKRVKVRAINYGEQPMRYVLAKDENEAKEHYLKATGLKALIEVLGGEEVAAKPIFSIRVLAD